jgi:hypothetical protein
MKNVIGEHYKELAASAFYGAERFEDVVTVRACPATREPGPSAHGSRGRWSARSTGEQPSACRGDGRRRTPAGGARRVDPAPRSTKAAPPEHEVVRSPSAFRTTASPRARGRRASAIPAAA